MPSELGFSPRAGYYGSEKIDPTNAHTYADDLCECCDGGGLKCPEGAVSSSGNFDGAGPGRGGSGICSNCAEPRTSHELCPECILRVREQYDRAN